MSDCAIQEPRLYKMTRLEKMSESGGFSPFNGSPEDLCQAVEIMCAEALPKCGIAS
jgi:hypothetical protein